MFKQFKRLFWRASLLTTLVSLLAFTVTSAASGNSRKTVDGDVQRAKPSRLDLMQMGSQSSSMAAEARVLAAPGGLDGTFDGDGRVTTDVNALQPGRSDVAFDVAIQSDGKILAAGYNYVPSTSIRDFAIARYTTTGALDTSFSGDGKLITNFGGEDVAYNVAVQSNGKIVVSGEVCNAPASIGGCDAAVARYNPGGGLDLTFGGSGKLLVDVGGVDNGSYGGLALQSDGKIVVAGYALRGATYDFAVYRFNINGTLDNTFSGDGIATFGFGTGRQDFATVIAIQPDGKIIVGGYSGDINFANNDFAVMRLKSNGGPDTTFSGDGRQTTDFGGNDFLWGFAGQIDGRFVTVGTSSTATLSRIALTRYKSSCAPDACLDTTFNLTGKKVFTITPGISSFGGDSVIQPDGKILVTGGDPSDMALVRLKPSGAMDTTFSGDGKVTIDFFGSGDFGWIVRRQSDGKYVLGGYAYDGSQYDFALARVLP